MKNITDFDKNKITLEELQAFYRIITYMELIEKVYELIEYGHITPIKSSKLNGKKPALYQAYRINRGSKDNSTLVEELTYQLVPMLDNDYYLRNIETYRKDRLFVLQLNDFLKGKKNNLQDSVSYNERSFEIWGREKFLLKEGGIRILKNLGISPEDLNVYDTTEPLAYYSHHKRVPQKILIIENKDTFYGMRRHLISGNTTILGTQIGSLIYGAGKSIHKSFHDFTFCMEPYLNNPSNEILYFGDLDYEGIIIFENLNRDFKDKVKIEPFCIAYETMINKSDIRRLPMMKKGQNTNISTTFLSCFNQDVQKKIMDILSQNKYIPQEILQRKDF
ncbi:MAG: hypothetical protein GX306_02595 [Clostridiales bacterium]|mgnify:CR=1 FL=1|jgi:hypothetical protein|nr:hypothetical protein [Clostridiales bacterium]